MPAPSTLQSLPSIDELLAAPEVAALLGSTPRPLVVQACRDAVAQARRLLLDGQPASVGPPQVARALEVLATPLLRPVINATGVVLHTNLGRAPLAARAVERVAQVAQGYANLELDLDEGERGSRYAPVVPLLTRLTGARAALVVNNCAAATVLALSALASGRAAVVSRGELVEIGGGFRMPDVMRQSGVRLQEVGTTNRTRLADYRAALDADTALLVKVHPSNFAVQGFTAEASVAELAGLAREKGLPLFVDAGTGLLEPLRGVGLQAERTMRWYVEQGATLVAFSGDKLLGGPQCGVVVGTAEAIARLERHPLCRALRVDKLTVSALEATLELYRDGLADAQVPARVLVQAGREAVRARAEALSRALQARGVAHRVREAEGAVGGGCLPLARLPSLAVVLEGPDEALHQALRQARPRPILTRMEDGAVWADVRCVADSEVEPLASGLAAAVEGKPW